MYLYCTDTSWRGKFSNFDRGSYSKSLRGLLGITSDEHFDLLEAQGCFWIEFGDCRRFFKQFCLNWNPALFAHRFLIHDSWPVNQGPAKDTFYIGDNPQYSLTLERCAPGVVVTIWVLLSRHISCLRPQSTDETKGFDDDDYLTCHVFNNTDGKRIFSPDKPFVQGVYTNDPNNLLRFDVDAAECSKSDLLFTLLISQQQKRRDLSYTLTVHSTNAPFELKRLPHLFANKADMSGSWSDGSSGGNFGMHDSYHTNPQYRLTVNHQDLEFHAMMWYPVSIRGNITIVPCAAVITPLHGEPVPDRIDSFSDDDIAASSGNYSFGFCHCAKVLRPGCYNIIMSNWSPDMKAQFRGLFASPSSDFSLVSVPSEGCGLLHSVIRGAWSAEDHTAAGCSNFGRYMKNPVFRLDFNHSQEAVYMTARLKVVNTTPIAMNLSLYDIKGKAENGSAILAGSSPKHAMTSSNAGVYIDNLCGVTVKPLWIPSGRSGVVSVALIPSTFEPIAAEFCIDVYSSVEVRITRVLGE